MHGGNLACYIAIIGNVAKTEDIFHQREEGF